MNPVEACRQYQDALERERVARDRLGLDEIDDAESDRRRAYIVMETAVLEHGYRKRHVMGEIHPMSTPTPSPPPLPAPALTQAYLAAAVAAIVALCLTQKFIIDATAQLITGIASIAIPLVIVGIHAIVQASAHSAHVGARSAREVADLAPAVTPVVYVSPECVLRIEASEDQVRRDLVEILAAVRPPDKSPDARTAQRGWRRASPVRVEPGMLR